MSLPGKDLNQSIPHDTHAVLKAYATAHGLQLNDLVRTVLGDWADKQVHQTTVMHEAMVVAGIVPGPAGMRRSAAE